MKRFTIAAALLVSACTSWAGLSVGGEFALEFRDYERTVINGQDERVVDAEENHFRFALVPSLIFPLSTAWELNPRAGISYEQDNNADGRFGFVLACGLFYHVIDVTPFTLSLGPDVMALGPLAFNGNVVDYTLNVGMPINADIHFNDRVFLRMGFRMVEVYLHVVRDDGPNNEPREREVGVNLLTLPSAFFGFYITF